MDNSTTSNPNFDNGDDSSTLAGDDDYSMNSTSTGGHSAASMGDGSSSASTGDDNQSTTGNSGAAMEDLQQEIAQLTQQLADADQKLQEMRVISQHALADLQNFKRRTEEEKASLFGFANTQLFLELIPALDNIHRALQHDPKDLEWVKGTEQTLRQLLQLTEKNGLKPIEALGQPFDPRFHEALMTGPGPQDTVVEEFEKGYMLQEKVIKLAKVKVGNGEEKPHEENAGNAFDVTPTE